MSAPLDGFFGEVENLRDASDELTACRAIVRLLGSLPSSDFGPEVWGEGASILAAQVGIHLEELGDFIIRPDVRR